MGDRRFDGCRTGLSTTNFGKRIVLVKSVFVIVCSIREWFHICIQLTLLISIRILGNVRILGSISFFGSHRRGVQAIGGFYSEKDTYPQSGDFIDNCSNWSG